MSDDLPECRSDAENTPEKISGPDSSYGNPDEVCSVCCSPLLPGEETIICPDCKKVYHKTCWNDNNGCTTYGCSSVGCLNPAPLKVGGNETASCATRKMVCPHCGISLTADVTFCWSCGRNLTEKEKNKEQRDGGSRSILEKLWSTNKWWAITAFCFLSIGGFVGKEGWEKTIFFPLSFSLILVAIVSGIIGFIKYVIGYIKRVGWNHFIKGPLKEIGALVAILNAIIIVILMGMEQVIGTVVAIIIETVVIIFIYTCMVLLKIDLETGDKN